MKLADFLKKIKNKDMKTLYRIISENRIEENRELIENELIHSFEYELQKTNLKKDEKIALIFEIYYLLPSYYVLARLKYNEAYLSYEENQVFWDNMIFYLGHDEEKYASPAAYWILVEAFEGTDEEVNISWDILSRNINSKRYFERLFEIAGPVPVKQKIITLNKYISDKSNHMAIIKLIIGSFYDTCGKYSVEDFDKIIEKLEVTENDKEVKRLKNDLQNNLFIRENLKDYIKFYDDRGDSFFSKNDFEKVAEYLASNKVGILYYGIAKRNEFNEIRFLIKGRNFYAKINEKDFHEISLRKTKEDIKETCKDNEFIYLKIIRLENIEYFELLKEERDYSE